MNGKDLLCGMTHVSENLIEEAAIAAWNKRS